MCGGANDSHFAAWPCSEMYLWGSKMSEMGSVHFYYKALTFYLQNIECADATPRVKRGVPPLLFTWFSREMSCKILFRVGGGVERDVIHIHFILQFSSTDLWSLICPLLPCPLFSSSQATWAPTVKSTMMNVSTVTAPIIPRVLTWLQTMSAFVLRALLVNYLCHHVHSLGLNENSAD